MLKRINVTISDTLNSKLDAYSEKYGVTKSSIVGFVLGQWMDNAENLNKSFYGADGQDGLLGEFMKRMMESAQKDK